MTRVFALLAFFAAGLAPILNASASTAEAGSVIDCVVASVKDDGEFENEYDFSFAQSPHVVVDLNSFANRKSVVIGALAFSEAEGTTIRSVYAYGTQAVEIAPSESDERFHVRISSRQGTGELQRQVKGAWVAVADLTCK